MLPQWHLLFFQPVFLNEVLVKLPTDPSSDEPVFHISHIDRVYTLRTDNINERWVVKMLSLNLFIDAAGCFQWADRGGSGLRNRAVSWSGNKLTWLSFEWKVISDFVLPLQQLLQWHPATSAASWCFRCIKVQHSIGLFPSPGQSLMWPSCLK